MTIPSSYSASTLKAYQHSLLGPVADALGWSVAGGSYDEALIDTLLAYGVTDIANATDITKLRALAAVAVWRQAQQAAAGLITFSSFGDRFEQGTIQERITVALAQAESRAVAYDTTYAVALTAVDHSQDPYRVVLDTDGGI